MHYLKINVPNYEVMRQELVNFTAKNVADQVRYWDVRRDYFKDTCPVFYDFIMSNSLIPVRLCRFYLTPPYDYLEPHIDGRIVDKSPFGLNLPVLGWENTTMDWYDCDESNMTDGNYGFGSIQSTKVIDFNKLKKVASVTIDTPTFVRTDHMHSVNNPNPTPRLILSVRWYSNQTLGQEFEDSFNVKRFL